MDNIPRWAIAPSDFPTWEGFPRHYRFDGEDGLFYRGSHPVSSLQAQIFAYRWVEAVRWGNPRQSYLDLAFVDGDGCVAQLPLRKDSALNLWEWILSLRISSHEALHVAAAEVLLASEPVVGARGIFQVVKIEDWSLVEEHRFLKVTAFEASDKFAFGSIGEVEDA